jgi:cell division protein FtsL
MKKKKYVVVKGEKVINFFIVISIIGLLLVNFVGQAMIQSSNSELQRLKGKINAQNEMNASIQMKINELASLDNALEVADTFGLGYNNSNIRVVSK